MVALPFMLWCMMRSEIVPETTQPVLTSTYPRLPHQCAVVMDLKGAGGGKHLEIHHCCVNSLCVLEEKEASRSFCLLNRHCS